MDTEVIKVGLQAINMVLTFGIAGWMYVEKRNDKTNEKVQALSEKVDAIDRDVSAIQAAAKNAPTHSDLAKVYDSINDVAKTVNQLVGENRSQTDTLRLILNRMTGG